MPTDYVTRPEDVVACYEMFLGRAPESSQIIESHVSTASRLWDFINIVYRCTEAERRSTHAACGRISALQNAQNIHTSATPEDLDRLTDHIRQVWSRYGEEEAYFSVLTNPTFLRERLGVADIEAFYATGVDEVAKFTAMCRRNRIEPDPAWSVLEFGCGVGRVGQAFAGQSATYTGVDISLGHLAIARERFSSFGMTNTKLLSLDSFSKDTETYDVVFSVLVLQHNPPPVILQNLDTCLSKLNPGGVIYIQIPCHLYDYAFSVPSYLAGEGRKEEMEIHAVPQRDIFALLARHGCVPLEVTPDDRTGPIGFSYSFLAQRQA